jgi:hypothetical protein
MNMLGSELQDIMTVQYTMHNNAPLTGTCRCAALLQSVAHSGIQDEGPGGQSQLGTQLQDLCSNYSLFSTILVYSWTLTMTVNSTMVLITVKTR